MTCLRGLTLLIAALLIAACGSNEPSDEQATTSTNVADLDAWHDCLIARIGRINSSMEDQLATIDGNRDETIENVRFLSDEQSRLRSLIQSVQEIYDEGTRMLNDVGLPATIEQAREDPDVAAALDEGTVEALAALSDAKSRALSSVLERESAHALEMGRLESELREASAQYDEGLADRRALEADREELINERDSTLSELEAALADTQTGDPDWSLCTGS